jgi:hypothetical protein
MGAVCAPVPLCAETTALNKRKRPVAQGRILHGMECFGNLNLTQELRLRTPKMALHPIDASPSLFGSSI